MRRLAVFLALPLLAGCSSSHTAAKHHFRPPSPPGHPVFVRVGQRVVYPPGVLQSGELVFCGKKRAAGAEVPIPGHTAGSSAIRVTTRANGSVEVRCPRKAGNI